MNKKRAGALLGIRLLLSIIFVIKYVNSRKHKEKRMEEYIDLVPILEGLSYDVDSFLSHIKEVKIREATG